MSGHSDDMKTLHWLLGIIQHVDVGLVVVDRDLNIQLWNGFMENHSGVAPATAIGRPLFEVLTDMPEFSLRRKIASVFLLENRAFFTWREAPWLTRFQSYRPITGPSEWMYQSATIFPLKSINGEVDQVCLMIYDVTDPAMDEQALAELNAELDLLSKTDGLTGLYNRRAWEDLLRAEYKREARSGRYSTLLMCDIDHFKRINDTYGHPAGDEAIRSLSATIRSSKRQSDIAGRYGGEEFVILLADTRLEGAVIYAERLRQAMEQQVVTYDGREIRFTISIGVAENGPAIADPDAWLRAADEALYRSKEEGRNRVSCAPNR